MSRREPPGFQRRLPELAALWFDSTVTGKRYQIAPPLAHALECAWLAGGMEMLGAALGWPGDDVRVRSLELQRQAADRLADLKQEEKHVYREKPLTLANSEIARRLRKSRER